MRLEKFLNWPRRRHTVDWDYYLMPALETGERLLREVHEHLPQLEKKSVVFKQKVWRALQKIKWPRFQRPKAFHIKEKLWQTLKVAGFSTLIFTVGFLTINVGAYAEITMAWLTQWQGTATESQLMGHVEEAPMPEQTLLPLAGDVQEEPFQLVDLNLEVVPPDNRLIIPKIDKNIPIVSTDPQKLIGADWQSLQKTFASDLQNGVIHYPGTADPGEVGNVFITGHSSYYVWDPGRYKNVFARLSQLEVGDDLIVYYEQQKYHYVVREKKEVPSNDVSVLEQGSEKLLTLMTCTPVGTNIKRLVVVAELVE